MAVMEFGSDGTVIHYGRCLSYVKLIADNGLSAKVVPV